MDSEDLQREMLEAEEELLDNLQNYSFEELIGLFDKTSHKFLTDPEFIKRILRYNKEYGQEIFFSSFRIIKAILAETEYRIRENKI